MAIITKPTIAKGQANEFDLSKSDLAVLSKVTSDSYFSDQANWSKVYIEYKSTEGKQHEMVIFDASETAPKGSFDISEKSKDDFEVQAVVIMDFDGGYLKLERGDLTVADFDISLGQVSGGSLSLQSSPFLTGLSGVFSASSDKFSNNNYTVTSALARSEYKLIDKTKYYTEFTLDSPGTFRFADAGIVISSNQSSTSYLRGLDGSENSIKVRANDANSVSFDVSRGSGKTTIATNNINTGDIVGMAIDIENLVVYIHVNGVWLNGADPEIGIGGFSNIYVDSLSDAFGKYICKQVWGLKSGEQTTANEYVQFCPEGFEVL